MTDKGVETICGTVVFLYLLMIVFGNPFKRSDD